MSVVYSIRDSLDRMKVARTGLAEELQTLNIFDTPNTQVP
jgi:hypothetical protein